MDRMDYVLHNQHHPRSATHYDPVHAAPGPWVPPNHHHHHHHHSQSPTVYPWHSHPPSMPHSFPHHPLQPAHSSEPFHLAPNGGLPPPVPGFHPSPPSDVFPGPISSRPYHASQHRPSMSLPGIPGTHLGSTSDAAFSNQMPGARPLSFQTPGGLGMPPAGANLDANSLPRPPFSLSDPVSNNFAQHSSVSPPFSIPQPPLPPSSFNASPPRRTYLPTAMPSTRASREAHSPPRASQSSSSSRRTHHRARRSMSSRFPDFDPAPDDEDGVNRHLFIEHVVASSRSEPLPEQQTDDAMLRHMQLARGVSTKLVASKAAIRSLQSVNIEELPESERTCVICYNDYGVETPEGINEAPLRLPKCKHVFGDHCIKKWFEDSDSCPYCRDKLHSEPKPQPQPQPQTAAAFMSMMRRRGIHLPPGLAMHADELLIRAMATTTDPDATPTSRQNSTGGRRSPPDDAGEQQRRTRPRHSNSDAQSSNPPSRPAPYERHTSSRSDGNPSLPTYPHLSSPARFSAPRPSASAQRRSWASTPSMAVPTSTTTETSSRRPTLPPTVMSPSAPTFYPRGGTDMMGRPAEIFGIVAGSEAPPAPPASSRLPSSLQLSTDVTQGGPQQNAINLPGSRSGAAHENTSPIHNHLSPSQIARNRPW